MPTGKKPPLRERKYARTKLSLLDAAVQEMEHTALDDIAVKALCEQADWSKPKISNKAKSKEDEKPGGEDSKEDAGEDHRSSELSKSMEGAQEKLQLHYNIQLILPNSRDQAVFDALFTSLKKHLL